MYGPRKDGGIFATCDNIVGNDVGWSAERMAAEARVPSSVLLLYLRLVCVGGNVSQIKKNKTCFVFSVIRVIKLEPKP